MSEEASATEAGNPPAATEAAESVTDAQNPAVEAPAAKPEEPAKTEQPPEKRGQSRYERRLNAAYRREAEAKARADLLERQLQETRQAQSDPDAPKLADFNFDEEAYRKAVEKRAADRVAKDIETKQKASRVEQERKQLSEAWEKRVAKADKKYDDFDEVVGEIAPTSVLSVAIMEADNGEDIAYYLGTHLDEARAIAAMPERAQIRAIGRLEAKLAAEPQKPKTPSKAPAPITPVDGKSAPTSDIPSDKDDINTWMRKENSRMAARTSQP